MPKTTDVPANLREFNRIFEKLSYRHNYAEAYRDFIDYAVACFSWRGNKETADRLQRKYGKEYECFGQLYVEWFQIQKKELSKTGQFEEVKWYDTLGTFYEIVSSGSKASWLGQFFTPPDLVTMLTLMVGGKEGAKARIEDCCAGSGRMLIAYHAYYPGNYTFAADIDSICANMTALNMALHGCEGQAICMDSLNPSDWRFGYAVNPFIRLTGGIPHLLPITKEQSVHWQHWESRKTPAEPMIVQPAQSVLNPPPPPEVKIGKHGQLSFF